MAYVRKKKTKGREYYQLVEGRRENGKVRQKVLVHLGDCPSVEKALRWWPGRILKLRKVAHEGRRGVRDRLRLMRARLTNESDECRKVERRFVDESGNMRRRKYHPHELKEAIFRYETGDWWPGDLFMVWQAEYWETMDQVARLERRAGELEERYLKLYARHGGDPEDARRLMRDRYRRLYKARKTSSRRLQAREEEARGARGKSILDIVAKTDPTLALQAIFNG